MGSGRNAGPLFLSYQRNPITSYGIFRLTYAEVGFMLWGRWPPFFTETIMELKQLSQITGVRERIFRYLIEQNAVPGLDTSSPGLAPRQGNPRVLADEQVFPVAVAAILHEHGFRGDALKEFVKRATTQWNDGRNKIEVDYRGVYPAKLWLDLTQLRRKLNHKEPT